MKHRNHLPQLDGGLFVTDGGIETTLIFHDGLDLPAFAAFDLLKDEEGTRALRRYYEPYGELARERGAGLVLESPTWRASPRWAAEIGYSEQELDILNRKAIALMEDLRDEYESEETPVVISGCVGPQDDGYNPAERLSASAARDYHSTQIATFSDTAADMVTAITMTYADEAVGVTRAAMEAGMPVAISFTLETAGNLPQRSGAGRGRRGSRPGDRGRARVPHDQLRAPHSLRRGARGERAVAGAHPRAARECLHQEPRRAGRGHRARPG